MRGTVIILMILSLNAEAKRLYGMAGCGLGHLIVGKDHQLLAAFTNFSASNSLAVTSGTSNCPVHDMRVTERLPAYIEPNAIQLASDVARGDGETLTGLSEVLGCRDSRRLGRALQDRYTHIFDGDTDAISRRIIEIVETDTGLADSCQG